MAPLVEGPAAHRGREGPGLQAGRPPSESLGSEVPQPGLLRPREEES